MRICRVATIPFYFMHNLGSQINAIVSAGYALDLACSKESGFETLRRMPGVTLHAIKIKRTISPFADLRALFQLWRLYRHGHFDIIHSGTPKAGLLSALAGRLAGVPIRLHTFTGQPWVNLSGPGRWLAKMSDWLITHLNTQCYADSASQREFLIAEGLSRDRDVKVLGAGSIAGVDLEKMNQASRRYPPVETRAALSIPLGAPVIVFIGRVTRDKGIVELVNAYARVLQHCPACHLVLVGPLEPERDALPGDILQTIQNHPAIHFTGYQPDPGKYLAIADLLCLPSYREGFGNVVIEAAAVAVPTVGTSIVGLRDAIVDGTTGLLVPPRDHAALADALVSLLQDDAGRKAMGLAAQSRAVDLFSASHVNSLVVHEYQKLLAQKDSRQ